MRLEVGDQGLLVGPTSEAPDARRRKRRCVVKLTADDLLDLGRWHFIQFRDSDTASAAMERYRRYLERRREEELQELHDERSQRDDLAA